MIRFDSPHKMIVSQPICEVSLKKCEVIYKLAVSVIKNKMIMSRIVLISCVSRKVGHKAKAKDLYKGPLFTSSLAFGQSLKPDKIFILSALHHLLDLNKEIEPYNVTLSKIKKNNIKKELKILTPDEKIEWGKQVINELKNEANILSDEFIVLAGKEYIKPIESYISNLKMPLQGKRVGERIKFMQNQK